MKPSDVGAWPTNDRRDTLPRTDEVKPEDWDAVQRYEAACDAIKRAKAIVCQNCAHPLSDHWLRPKRPCLHRDFGELGEKPIDCRCKGYE
jgi:hypothetical protein